MSKISKDDFASIRISKEIKAWLKTHNMSPQKIVDAYIKDNLEVKTTTTVKLKGK